LKNLVIEVEANLVLKKREEENPAREQRKGNVKGKQKERVEDGREEGKEEKVDHN
jgi:hypothetical protein